MHEEMSYSRWNRTFDLLYRRTFIWVLLSWLFLFLACSVWPPTFAAYYSFTKGWLSDLSFHSTFLAALQMGILGVFFLPYFPSSFIF